MPLRRSVFRRLFPLLFALWLCGSVFADSGEEPEPNHAEQESVKTPNRVERVRAGGAKSQLGICAVCENIAREQAAVRVDSKRDARQKAQDLLWLDAPLLDDLPIEALDFSRAGERDELTAQRMRRVVLGGGNVILWERDEAAGPDLFAEAQSALPFAASDPLGLLVSAQSSLSPAAAILPPSDFADPLSQGTFLAAPQFSLTLSRLSESSPARIGSFDTSHHVAMDGLGAVAREPPRSARAPQLPSLFSIGGSSGNPPFAASDSSDRAAARLPIEQIAFEKVPQKDWGPTRNVLAIGNYLLTADRSLAALKLDGVGTDRDREGYLLGRVITLNKHTLTLTGAGLLSVGERRDLIEGGTLATTRENFEIHVTGGGPDYGGLEISAILANGPHGDTGLIKTGSGELIISNQQKNTLRGDIHVKAGTLTLRSKDGAIPGKAIYVGDGTSGAVLNLKGGRDHINPEASVTLRGSESGAAVLRFEKTHPSKGVVQTLEKLVIEGSGVIEFIDPFITEGKGTSPHKNALYIEELDLRGDLTIRGWDQYDTQIFIKRSVQPDEVLLSKIHVEGHANLRVSEGKNGYWSLEAAPIPEPAICGAIGAVGALALLTWRRRRRRAVLLAGLPTGRPARRTKRTGPASAEPEIIGGPPSPSLRADNG